MRCQNLRDFGSREISYVSCIYPLDIFQWGKTFLQTLLLLVKKSALRYSMPRDVGSVVLSFVGFGVTGWYSDFGGRLSLP